MKKQLYFIVITLGLFSGCKKTAFETVERTSGTADFKQYISVGNSLTQGYQDAGLYEEGQSMSYPSIIAQQMKIAQPNMAEFRQPMVSGNGSGYMHLGYINGSLKPISSDDPGGYQPDGSWDAWGQAEKNQKFNNLGIAGVKLIQCVNTYSDDNTTNAIILGGLDVTVPIIGTNYTQDGNPFSRYLDFGEAEVNVPVIGNIGGTAKSYLDHVKESNATFFTCWLGNNDVLGYVVNGGTPNLVENNTIGLSVDLNALSDEFEFEEKYDEIIKAFKNQGAQGVCSTLPNVTSIPFVTTFTVASLKADYNYNKVWITDLNENVREATEEDYILLHASEGISNGRGTSQATPFTNYDVLDRDEATLAKNHTLKLNGIIRKIAGSYGYPIADMYTYMDNLSAGYTFEGIDMDISYIQGGTFSLDGIHPNPRGYAVVANEFIRVINAAYNSNIPKVSVGAYRGILFP